MTNNLQEWIDKPIPDTKEGIQNWLDEMWKYLKEVGDTKVIAELAESDVLEGREEPASRNPVYVAAFNFAKAYHSIEVNKNE